MSRPIDRRSFLKLTGLGSAVFASGLSGVVLGGQNRVPAEDFYFAQLSDSHWGFKGPKINPDAEGTLPKAVAAVNELKHQPDFLMFTGDLTHITDSARVRAQRMAGFRRVISKLKVQDVRFIPGENDASLDYGHMFKKFFGPTYYEFSHKGIHFFALDNVSDPRAVVGSAQRSWLRQRLASLDRDTPIVVFAHRPLFNLYPAWDWATRDGDDVVALLIPFHHVTVFYGHIHQENHHKTGHIAHHSAQSLIFPLPAPGSQPKRAPVPWDSEHPYRGLGYRSVEADEPGKPRYQLTERAIRKG